MSNDCCWLAERARGWQWGMQDAVKQRDAHRAALNQIADALGVVHEDDKIVAAVLALVAAHPTAKKGT